MKNVRDPVRSPIFVGRDFEMGRLEEALAKAGLGRAAVVLIAGEAGVGHTVWVTSSKVAPGPRGSLIALEGGCVQLGGEGLPLGPVIEALRSVPLVLSPDELAAMLGPGRTELARLVPAACSTERRRGGRRRLRWLCVAATLFEHLLGLLVGSESGSRCCWCSRISTGSTAQPWRSRDLSERRTPPAPSAPAVSRKDRRRAGQAVRAGAGALQPRGGRLPS